MWDFSISLSSLRARHDVSGWNAYRQSFLVYPSQAFIACSLRVPDVSSISSNTPQESSRRTQKSAASEFRITSNPQIQSSSPSIYHHRPKAGLTKIQPHSLQMRHHINMFINSMYTKPRSLPSGRKSIDIPCQIPVLYCVRISLHDVSYGDYLLAC